MRHGRARCGRGAPLARGGGGVWSGFVGPLGTRRATGAVGRSGARGTASHCKKAMVFFPRRARSAVAAALDHSSGCAPSLWEGGEWGKGFWSTAQRERQATNQKEKQEARLTGNGGGVSEHAFFLPAAGEPRGCTVSCTAHQPPVASCRNVVGGCPTSTEEGLEQAIVNCRKSKSCLLLGAVFVLVRHRETLGAGVCTLGESAHTSAGSLRVSGTS